MEKKKVLLVDDEAPIINFLEKFMKRLKIASVKTTSGREAIELYNNKEIDCVFLDISLADINGFEVLRQLQNKYPKVKVILITGRPKSGFEDEAKKLGVVDYITKPLDLEDLQDKINKYVL